MRDCLFNLEPDIAVLWEDKGFGRIERGTTSKA